MGTGLESFAFFLGKAICHQLHERTFFIDGHYLPVCARCTGIYIGIFFSVLLFGFGKKFRSNTIPTTKISIFLLVFLLPLIIDGFGSYLGFYSTTNLVRVITGVLFGVILPIFVLPLLNHTVTSTNRVMTDLRRFYYTLALALLLALLSSQGFIPLIILDLLIVGSLVSWVAILFLLFYKKIRNRFISIGFSYMSSILVLFALSTIHSIIENILR